MTLPDLGLEIVLPALFVVLAVEQYRTHRAAGLMLIACLIGLVAIWLWQDKMLLLSISTALVLILINYVRQRWTRHSI
jgi:predicted branched-subunit amino acid permease